MRIGAIYIRVSTDSQTEYSPDAQLKAIIEYAEKNDILIRDEFIFSDEGISGKKAEKRPAFMQMIGLAKAKKFDVILVHKFSRFARSREDSIVYKSMLRKQYGIDVISITEPVGEDKISIVIEAMHEAMDEYYSINLAGEVMKGMKEKATRGEIQTTPAFGYAKKPNEPMIIVDHEADIVRRIFQEYADGESMFAITRRLNDIGVTTKRGNKIENRFVEYVLNNPLYIGYVRWSPERIVSKRIYNDDKTITVKSSHDPIITQELWDIVSDRLRQEKASRKKYEKPINVKKHYLSGLLKCSNCGGSLVYGSANDGFQCVNYSHGVCNVSHFVSANKIETAIIDKLAELKHSSYIEIEVIDRNSKKIDQITKEIQRLEDMLERIFESYIKGYDSVDDYGKAKMKILAEIALKQKELDNIDVPKADQQKVRKKINGIADYLKGDADNKNYVLKQAIKKIVFDKQKQEVSIFFYDIL